MLSRNLNSAMALALLAACATSCGGTQDDTGTTDATFGEPGSTSQPTSSTTSSTSTTSTSTGTLTSTVAASESSTTGESTGTSSTGTSESDSTDSSTGPPGPCREVHEGDLQISENTDLSALATIGRVTGTVYINMLDRDQTDLSFFSCLHTIDKSLVVSDNKQLQTTEGIVNLQSVSRITIFDNPKLQTISGFEQISELITLKIYYNPSLEDIVFESLESVNTLTIGYCDQGGGTAKQPLLVDLIDFAELTSVVSLHIDGNEMLMAAAVLDALAANGSSVPLGVATVRFNPMLPEAAVHAQLDVLGLSMRDREVCGNAEGDPECLCIVG
jgi:hypothetical protein